MTTRERNRYVLCQVVSEKQGTGSIKPDSIVGAFRLSVQNNWGELGYATFGSTSRMVISFADICGLFIIRIPMQFQAECLHALSSIISLASRPVSVRVLHISGRLKNTVKTTTERVLEWRNSLPMNYSVPRKDILEAQVRQIVTALHSLPPYV